MPGLLESTRIESAAAAEGDAETQRLTALWKTYWLHQDRLVRNELILNYEPVVSIVIARMPSSLRTHWEVADLHSFGLLGLVEAIDRFEPGSLPGRFPSYAMARIRGAVFDELRRLDWLPRTVRRRVINYRSTVEELSGELGRVPATGEVITEMGLNQGEASDLLQAVQSSQLMHLQQASDGNEDGESAPIIDLLATAHEDGPEAQVLFSERISEVREAITRLPERQRTVVSLRFFGGLTQDQIGVMLGVSNSRICQIESAAMGSLRRMLADDVPARKPQRRVS